MATPIANEIIERNTMTNEIINSTLTDSKLSGLNSFRAEFEDGFEHFKLSLHCDELDLEQETNTRDSYRVKSFTARGRNGNVAILQIFFNK
jgi:hypothetical protein